MSHGLVPKLVKITEGCGMWQISIKTYTAELKFYTRNQGGNA
jgi:hypothetical protein